MQANAGKCKQMHAIRMETLETNSKLKEIDVKAGPPRINNPLINPKRLFENNIDNIVKRQFVKQIRENASEYKQLHALENLTIRIDVLVGKCRTSRLINSNVGKGKTRTFENLETRILDH